MPTLDGAHARLERLYIQHADSIYRFARMRVGPDKAEDVVAETFLVAWRRVNDVPSAALPWLFTVARNVMATYERTERRQMSILERAMFHLERTDHGDQAEETQERDILVGALRRLSSSDQELLLTWAWFDVSTAEGSAMLGCSKSAYSVRLHRARNRLRRELERTADMVDQNWKPR